MLVSLGSREQNVNPDGHGFWRWRHQVVDAVVGLHAKGQLGVGAFNIVHVVGVYLLYGLETHRTLQFGLGLVGEVEYLDE